MKKELAMLAVAIPLLGCAVKNVASSPPRGIEEICKGPTLAHSMACLNEAVKSVYNYRLTDDDYSLTRTPQDVIDNGGDCLDYALLYGTVAESMGYNAQITFFSQRDGPWAHAYATIWDEEMNQYCVADQTKMVCFQLGGVLDEVPDDMYKGEEDCN